MDPKNPTLYNEGKWLEAALWRMDLRDQLAIIGRRYRDNLGDVSKLKKFFELNRRADEAGSDYGTVCLGYAYEHGVGCEVNYEKAKDCYLRAAKKIV
uniref:Sel1 repeat-containing protein n=1 Tax=Candidatus Kentrum sp. SD TaxID=2126332 RepID=A0A450YZX8_9GAMM|nr:MAG: Sel1 repeat-containing protein [Candidatus Kentron sp. SD]VFK47077.1 MAG: Sel1 repeat-containing protein [Candidatus Kentron sp. SD]